MLTNAGRVSHTHFNSSLLVWSDQTILLATILECRPRLVVYEVRSQLLAHQGGLAHQWHSNLIHVDVRVGGDDRTSSKIHPLAHHVLPKETLLLL